MICDGRGIEILAAHASTEMKALFYGFAKRGSSKVEYFYDRCTNNISNALMKIFHFLILS